MRRAIVVLAVAAAAGLPAGLRAAPPAIAGDECSAAPSLAAELEYVDDGGNWSPDFIGDRVWFGGSVYLPDGTLVGPAPDGVPRGEVPEFTDDTLNTSTVTWGVVVDTPSDGAKVFSPDGDALFDLPIPIHAEAVYGEDLILAADWRMPPSDLIWPVMLVKQDGGITELTSAAVGNQQFGTVIDQTVYVVMHDGGIATFDSDGIAGPVLAQSVQFSGVTSANGYLYAYEGTPVGAIGAGTVLHVFTAAGDEVATIDLGGSAVRMGPTALGFAADIVADAGNQAVAMAPNGGGGTSLDGLHDTTDPADALAWHQGRYLIGIDATAETPAGVTTGQLELYRLDGVPLGTSESFEYRNWPAGRPAGKVLAFAGSDGQSIDFRSLSGTLLASVDYSSDPTTHVEAINGNDDYVWVTTTDPGYANHTAHVYALGECAGKPDPGRFLDDDGSIFEADIEWLAGQAITRGCNPAEANIRFCPDDTVTRGQMAAFLVRALGYTDPGVGDLFTDDDNSIFETAIDILGTAGITRGCNPPTNDQYCPNDPVTRGQMAALLVRALR